MKKLIIPNGTVTAKADPRLNHDMAKKNVEKFHPAGF